jgi:hypothetical protein
LTHASNARFQQPNLGLNTAALRFGLAYTPQPLEKRVAYDYSVYPFARQWKPFFRVELAVKELKAAKGPRYPVWTGAAGVQWHFRRQNQLLAGLGLSHDQATEAFMKEFGIPREPGQWNYLRPHLFLGHEFLLGRVGILTQTFFYLDQPFQGQDFMGFQIGPNLYFTHPRDLPGINGFVGIYLKAHRAIADYAGLTVGMSF